MHFVMSRVFLLFLAFSRSWVLPLIFLGFVEVLTMPGIERWRNYFCRKFRRKFKSKLRKFRTPKRLEMLWKVQNHVTSISYRLLNEKTSASIGAFEKSRQLLSPRIKSLQTVAIEKVSIGWAEFLPANSLILS